MKKTEKEHRSLWDWLRILGYAFVELLRRVTPILWRALCGVFRLLDVCLSFLWSGLIRLVCLISPTAADKLNSVSKIWNILPEKLPKSAILLTFAFLVIMASGTGETGGVTTGSNFWDRDRDTFTPSFLNDCVFCTDGKETCSACDGKRGKYVYGSTPNYSGSTGASTSHQTWQSCSKCGGTGKQSCSHCGGDGKR